MAVVMLRKDWGGVFHRTVFKDGKPAKVLRFNRGEPVDLQGEDLEAVKKDIGHALLEVSLDGKDRPRAASRLAADDSQGGEQADQLAAAQKQLELVSGQLEKTQDHARQLETALAEAEDQVGLLIEQVKELGAEPIVELAAGEVGADPPGEGEKRKSRRRRRKSS